VTFGVARNSGPSRNLGTWSHGEGGHPDRRGIPVSTASCRRGGSPGDDARHDSRAGGAHKEGRRDPRKGLVVTFKVWLSMRLAERPCAEAASRHTPYFPFKKDEPFWGPPGRHSANNTTWVSQRVTFSDEPAAVRAAADQALPGRLRRGKGSRCYCTEQEGEGGHGEGQDGGKAGDY